MGWFRFILRGPDGIDLSSVAALPGVSFKGPGLITAHENVAWLVEEKLNELGMVFTILPPAAAMQPLTSLDQLVPNGLREWVPAYLTPYQTDGILATAHRDAHLWWAAGSGKTLGAICWALAVPERTVLVTRAGVRRSHGREIERYTEHRAMVIEESADADELPASDALFAVVGWEMLPDIIGKLLAWKPHNLVFDELHRCKSNKRWSATALPNGKVKFDPKENIAFAAYQLSRAVRRRLGTTATPIKDRTRDLWAQLDLIHPDAWGRFYAEGKASFTGRYCSARAGMYGGIDTSGASNLDELWKRVSLVVDQVPHSVTHRHLPPRRRIVTYVTPAEQCRAEGFTKTFFKQAAKGGQSGIIEARLMEAASKKRKVLIDLVEEAMACKQKVTIFTGRREDCDRLAEDVRKALDPEINVYSGHGGTPAGDRDTLVQAYMADTGPCVFVGTGDAFGECLEPDTMILGANKTLRECVEGDQVVGESGISANVGATVHPYEGHMVEIKARGLLPMRSTTGHATLTVAGGYTRGRGRHFEFRSGREWKNAEDVKPWNPSQKSPVNASGDFLLVPRLPGKFSDVKFDLNRFVKPEMRQGRKTRGMPQELALDAEVAWVLGLYVAEGSATIQSNGQARVSFSLGAHEQHLADRVESVLRARGFKVKSRIQKTWMHVEAKSTPLGYLFRELFGTGAHSKKIPDEILLNTDLEVLRAFLAGYEEGDGHTSADGRKVSAATVSEVLALQLQLALARLGRFASVSKHESKLGSIQGRQIKSGPFYSVRWTWKNARHERFKVLDKYIATPVVSVTVTPFKGDVGYLSTQDKTMLASNAIVHNGVNMHDTDLALIAMLPYTPGAIVQWEGRFSRHGQKRPVLIQYLVAEGTVDEHVVELLLNKLRPVEQVSKDDSIDGFADSLRGADEEEAIVQSILGKLGV